MHFLMSYILAGIGTVIVIFWSLLFFKYRNRFDNIINAMDSKRFMMRELFFIGFGVMDMFNIRLKSEASIRKEKKIAEVYGEKYAAFYNYCVSGGQITYMITIAPFGFFIGAITNQVIMAILAIAAAAAIVAYLDMQINDAVEKKRDEILCDYPDVLSKLTLLVNAGLVVREAWSKVAYTSDRALYKEMQTTSEEMENGKSEVDALFDFAQRCAVKEIRKFASVLSQNIQKGGSELILNLRYMNEESWEEKKHRAKMKGEAASSKLMLPVMIMFIGILFMVIIPIFSSMM